MNSTHRKISDLTPTIGNSLSSGLYHLMQCRDCETIYLSPLPTPGDFKNMYEDSTQFTSDEYCEPQKVKGALAYYAGCFRNMVALLGLERKTVQLLEIGAGLGWMARAAKESGMDVLTVAQDVSPEGQTLCNWVDEYIIGAIEDPRISQLAPYHIISMTHVIEHLSGLSFKNPSSARLTARSDSEDV